MLPRNVSLWMRRVIEDIADVLTTYREGDTWHAHLKGAREALLDASATFPPGRVREPVAGKERLCASCGGEGSILEGIVSGARRRCPACEGTGVVPLPGT